MEVQYIIAISWLSGFLLSWWMIQVEHEAEHDNYTNGERAMCVLLSTLSWPMVMYLLIKAWAVSVKNYWGKTHKPKKAE
jgi:hypothetical protein